MSVDRVNRIMLHCSLLPNGWLSEATPAAHGRDDLFLLPLGEGP